MDILNFISWIKSGRQVTTVNANQTLLPVGLKDPKRDDGYLAGAITVEDFVAQIAPPVPESTYKVYAARIFQNGTNPPFVDVVLENTIGINPNFIYTAVGQYAIEFPGLFPFNEGNYKVLTFFTTGTSNSSTTLQQGSPDTSFIYISTTALVTGGPFTAGQFTNSLLNGSLEIRVYN
jgi:hypothetical protein